MADLKPFLFEIGTEELPPKSLKKLADVLERELLRQLTTQGLVGSQVSSRVYASPRRLAVFVDAVADRQPDQVIDRKGPAVNRAYDEQGQPTPAAIGFARSVGLDVDQIKTQKTGKGEWLFCRVQKPGQTATELLPGCVENALKALPIPKRMRWGSHEAEFIRPVKWIIMLLGTEVVEAEILSVKSDRYTKGHRFHAMRRLRLLEADEYESLLEQEGMVIADYAKRKQEIFDDISRLARQKQAQVLLDQDLLDEVTGLVELPVALLGNIEQTFMDLPQEVLISSMQDHQKYFPIVGDDGILLPHFITVSNIRSKDEDSVISGNEKVLRARLSDAQFFWDTDRKIKLADRKPMLAGVLFQQKLGSLGNKVERIKQLATALAEKFNLDAEQVGRAAELCKLDLVTDMVGEFPELQGVMGKYYALHDSEDQQVTVAVEQHYWPRFAGDQIPQSKPGQALAIADKLDTICGLFAIGQVPTGDRDPFALRRSALGIVRISIEGELDLDINWAVSRALNGYSNLAISNNVNEEIFGFIFERLKTLYQSQGFDTRLYQSVFEAKPVSPLDFDQRLKAVAQFMQLGSAASLIEVNKRISNILQKANIESIDVDPGLLDEYQEKVLFDRLQEITDKALPLLNDNHYADFLTLLTELKQPVDDFFDHVMVMDENLARQQNRIALLARVRQLFQQVADVSFLK